MQIGIIFALVSAILVAAVACVDTTTPSALPDATHQAPVPAVPT